MQMNVLVTKSADRNLRDILRNKGISVCREKLAQFLKEFKEQKGYLVETKVVQDLSSPQQSVNKEAAAASSPAQPQQQQINTQKTPAQAPQQRPRDGTTSISFTEKFNARSGDIYECLTDPRRIAAYVQSNVNLEPKEGGKFSLFDGHITGEFIQLHSNQKIVQKWRTSSWPEGLCPPFSFSSFFSWSLSSCGLS